MISKTFLTKVQFQPDKKYSSVQFLISFHNFLLSFLHYCVHSTLSFLPPSVLSLLSLFLFYFSIHLFMYLSTYHLFVFCFCFWWARWYLKKSFTRSLTEPNKWTLLTWRPSADDHLEETGDWIIQNDDNEMTRWLVDLSTYLTM